MFLLSNLIDFICEYISHTKIIKMDTIEINKVSHEIILVFVVLADYSK